MQVHKSAFTHGFTEDEIRYALEHRHISYDVIDQDPPRTWAFGFTPDGRLLELIILHTETDDLVIHCMKARKHELDKALRVTRGRY